MNTLRRRLPPPWTASSRRNLPFSDAGPQEPLPQCLRMAPYVLLLEPTDGAAAAARGG
jgi:hypothetical protein